MTVSLRVSQAGKVQSLIGHELSLPAGEQVEIDVVQQVVTRRGAGEGGNTFCDQQFSFLPCV